MAAPANLPVQVTSFVGRERERAEVRQLLAGARVEGQERDLAPSIETFVHAVCLAVGGARLVAHTHPTAVNKLLCARDAPASAQQASFSM